MNEDCKLLKSVKNVKLVAVYEDNDSCIEIIYEKDNIKHSLLVKAKAAGGSMGFPQWLEFSNEKIPETKRKKVSLFSDIDTIKHIDLLHDSSGGDRYEWIRLLTVSNFAQFSFEISVNGDGWCDGEKAYDIRKQHDGIVRRKQCTELFSVESYKKHLAIALKAHKNQLTPHGLPYAFHIVSVATEVINALPAESISVEEANIAIACALLHDVLEDTDYDLESEPLNAQILDGVKALTKNKKLSSKQKQMQKSLHQLKKLPKYIQMVKLADRITNLDTPPPHWSNEKKIAYRNEATLIRKSLLSPNMYLNSKLWHKIDDYSKYIDK